MPLLHEWDADPHSLAAIWKIEEPEAFFNEATGLYPDIKSEKRRLERLAGRYLLQYLKLDFPLHHIFSDAHDKPRIPDDRYRFSISHSYPYVAAVVSDRYECGIDVQTWHPRMLSLQRKFLSAGEQALFAGDPKLITLAWSAKEAAYKWQGRRGIEFIEQLPVRKFLPFSKGYRLLIEAQYEGSAQPVHLQAAVYQDYALAWVVNEPFP